MPDLTKLTKAQLIDIIQKQEEEKFAVLKEETGLSDLKIHHRFRHISKYNITKNFSTGEKLEAPEPKQVTYFLAQSANKNVTLSFEHQEFGWFSFIEAREKLKNTKKYKVLNSVIQFFIDKKYL